MRNIKITFLLLCLGYANAPNSGWGRLGGNGPLGNSEYRSSSQQDTAGDAELARLLQAQEEWITSDSNQPHVTFKNVKALREYIRHNEELHKFSTKIVRNADNYQLKLYGTLLVKFGIARESNAFLAAFEFLINYIKGDKPDELFFDSLSDLETSLRPLELDRDKELAPLFKPLESMDINKRALKFGHILPIFFEMAGMNKPKWLTDFLTDAPQGPQTNIQGPSHSSTPTDRVPGAGIMFSDGIMAEDPPKVQFSQQITDLLYNARDALQRGDIQELDSIFNLTDILAQFDPDLKKGEFHKEYITAMNRVAQLGENLSFDEFYNLIELLSQLISADMKIDPFIKQEINRIPQFFKENRAKLLQVAQAIKSDRPVSFSSSAYANGGGGHTPMNMTRQVRYEAEHNPFGMRPHATANGHNSPSQTANGRGGYALSQAAGAGVAAASPQQAADLSGDQINRLFNIIKQDTEEIASNLNDMVNYSYWASQAGRRTTCRNQNAQEARQTYLYLRSTLCLKLYTLKREGLKNMQLNGSSYTLSDNMIDQNFKDLVPLFDVMHKVVIHNTQEGDPLRDTWKTIIEHVKLLRGDLDALINPASTQAQTRSSSTWR